MTHDRVPVCNRCRLHPGIIGVYDKAIQANEQVCFSCLTLPERMGIEAARLKQSMEPSLFEQQCGGNGPWRDQG